MTTSPAITWAHVERAINDAKLTQQGHTDWAGRPAEQFDADVADRIQADHPLRQTVAWLHATAALRSVETRDDWIDRYLTRTYGRTVADAVEALTRGLAESEGDWYARVAANPDATAVLTAMSEVLVDPRYLAQVTPERRTNALTWGRSIRHALGLNPGETIPNGRILVRVGDVVTQVGRTDEPLRAVVAAGQSVPLHMQQVMLVALEPAVLRGHVITDAEFAGHDYQPERGDAGWFTLPGDFTVITPAGKASP